jgi:hypothetical protein
VIRAASSNRIWNGIKIERVVDVLCPVFAPQKLSRFLVSYDSLHWPDLTHTTTSIASIKNAMNPKEFQSLVSSAWGIPRFEQQAVADTNGDKCDAVR